MSTIPTTVYSYHQGMSEGIDLAGPYLPVAFDQIYTVHFSYTPDTLIYDLHRHATRLDEITI